MPQAVYIDNHEEIALDIRLPRQFHDKVFIEAYVKTFIHQIQDIEDFFEELRVETEFYAAEGVHLDRYGHILGILRPSSLTDEEYRKFLVIEIIRRSSDGTPDKIREVLEAVTDVTLSRYHAHEPSGILVYGKVPFNTDTVVAREEAIALKVASPVETGSAIYGKTYTYDALWIPAELKTNLIPLGAKVENKDIMTVGDLSVGWIAENGASIDTDNTFTVSTATDSRVSFSDPEGISETDLGRVSYKATLSATSAHKVRLQILKADGSTVGQVFDITTTPTEYIFEGLLASPADVLRIQNVEAVSITVTVSGISYIERDNLSELIDQNGDTLSVKSITGTEFTKNDLRGLLPEFGVIDEVFTVEQVGYEDAFATDTNPIQVEAFFFVNVEEGVSRNHGIMLEINQFTIDETN